MTTFKATYKSQEVTIYLKQHIFEQLNKIIDVNQNYFIITDQNVGALYLNILAEQLPNSKSYVITPGEASKSITNINEIIKKMLSENIGKETTIIALGGGVVGDLAGFIAGIYKRGIPLINIPTTLLAQVDSSIGGKTGVNIENYKNQIGVFYHPQTVIIDPMFLNTLPERELLNGYAELIKYAFIKDNQLYQLLKNNDPQLNELIERAISIKIAITTRDEFEKNERKILNFGHTIGHALESLSNFRISHGEAVALGMIYETNNPEVKRDLIEMLAQYQLPTNYPNFNINEIAEYIFVDKKRNGQNLTIPVVDQVGNAALQTLPIAKWKERWQ